MTVYIINKMNKINLTGLKYKRLKITGLYQTKIAD